VNTVFNSNNENFENHKNIDNDFFVSSVSFIKEKSFTGKIITQKECKIDGSKRLGYTS
jgi:hypothetical protein